MVDVVVPVYRDVAMTEGCLRRVLETAGPLLGQLIVVNDASPEPGMLPMLEGIARAHARTVLLHNERNLGFVRSANRGLALRRGDALLLNSDTLPTPGWLEELHAVASGSDQVAAVVPLSNNATLCSVPDFGEEARPEDVPWEKLELAHAGPRATEMPTGVGFCLYLSGRALDLLGVLDPAYGRGYHEENDWCARARQAGLRVLRANRAFVYHLGTVSFGTERWTLDAENERRLVARYPGYRDANRRFADGPEAHVAALRAHRRLRGKMTVAVYGGEECLPRAALVRDGVELAEAETSRGRAHVVHVTGPVLDRGSLGRLLGLGAHVLLEGSALLEAARVGGGAWACTELLATAAQGVLVHTGAEESEIRARFPLAADRLARVPGWAPSWRGGQWVRERSFCARVDLAAEGLLPWLLGGYATYRAAALETALPLLLEARGGSRSGFRVPQGVEWVGALPGRSAAAVWLRGNTAWPIGALEALAGGTPVIAQRMGASVEALGEAAHWVDPGDTGRLAQLLEQLGAGKQDETAARARVEAIGPAASARSLQELYERVLDAPAEAPLRAHAHLREFLAG